MSDRFYFALGLRSAGKSAQTYKKLSSFSFFSRLGPFPQVFGQVKEWVILELNEMIKVLPAVACSMDNLLSDRGQQLGVLKMLLC